MFEQTFQPAGSPRPPEQPTFDSLPLSSIHALFSKLMKGLPAIFSVYQQLRFPPEAPEQPISDKYLYLKAEGMLPARSLVFISSCDVLRASNIWQSPCIHIPYSVVIGTYQSKRLLAMSLVYMSSCVWSEGQRVPQSNQYPTVSLSKYHSVPRLSPTNTQPSCQGLNYFLWFGFLRLLTISFSPVVCSCYQ